MVPRVPGVPSIQVIAFLRVRNGTRSHMEISSETHGITDSCAMVILVVDNTLSIQGTGLGQVHHIPSRKVGVFLNPRRFIRIWATVVRSIHCTINKNARVFLVNDNTPSIQGWPGTERSGCSRP